MTKDELKKKYGKQVRSMDVACPVDLDYLFRDGLVERPKVTGKTVTVSGQAGVYVPGSVSATNLKLNGHALWVEGDVVAKQLKVAGNMVVMGDLTVDDVRGSAEPFSLTVVGKTTVRRAVAERGFIYQFLGSGMVELLVDTEGGAEELAELLAEAGSKVKIKRRSDELS